MSKLYTFCNNKSSLDLVALNSCYCDSKKLLNLAQKHTAIENFNFSIVSAAQNDQMCPQGPAVRIKSYKPLWMRETDEKEFDVHFDATLSRVLRKVHKKVLEDTDKGLLVRRFLEKRWRLEQDKPSVLLAGSSEQFAIKN